MKIQIKSVTGSILFECDAESVAKAVIEAIKAKINLRSANLSYADLRSANLSYANLSSANLSYANLRYADLSYADLRSANLTPLQKAQISIVPDSGSFIGWKKCVGGIIVKLEIPAGSKRSNATGRKCRAEFVEVLELTGGAESAKSIHDPDVIYRVGEIVRCDKWEEDRFIECGGGIHFYITKEEAENHK